MSRPPASPNRTVSQPMPTKDETLSDLGSLVHPFRAMDTTCKAAVEGEEEAADITMPDGTATPSAEAAGDADAPTSVEQARCPPPAGESTVPVSLSPITLIY